MKKKGKASSSMERKKNNKISIVTNNNKKEIQSKPKQPLNKSVEKKRKIGLNLTTESGMNNTTIETKSQKDKTHITRQRKDKTGSQKTINSRSAKSNKTKEYENTLNKLTEDNDYEKEKEKEYDFFNYKANNDNSKKKTKEKDKNKLKSVNNNDEDNSKRKKNNAKSVKSVNTKEDKNKKKLKNKIYNNNNEDYSDEEEEKEKNDDFIHRALYRTSLDNKGLNDDKYKSPNIQNKIKYKKNKETERNNDLTNNQSNDNFTMSMEKTDDIRYSIGDKKIYSNISNDRQKNYKTEYNNDADEKTKNDYYPKYEKRKIYSLDKSNELIDERTIDFFVIDGDDETIITSKYKKKIDRKRNKFKEILIEKYDSNTPIRNDKLTGFVLIRKNKGKKIYDLHLEDDIDKINSIFKNKEVMIKNELIQIIPLKKLITYQNDQKNYNEKIFKLQSDLNKKEFNKEKDKDEKREKDKEKDKQISILKSKNEELNNIVKNQEQQLNQNEKELKQIKLSYDKLKESYQTLEKENKTLMEQAESYKLKKKVVQFQLDEKNDQKNINKMKERIKKYKDELRKVPPVEARHRLSFSRVDELISDNNQNVRKRHKGSVHYAGEKSMNIKAPQIKMPKEGENEDDEEEEYDIRGDGKDPKAKKMKNALVRLKQKYHDEIKEEKKIAKMKEKEEKEKEENEEKEIENDNNNFNYEENLRKQKEEEERIIKEERERREKEEREKKEREERERREREERERKEREEREKKERERREKEERERKEKEEKEKKERERKEREKREREERERKEREKKEKERKEKEERERKEKERKEKERKEKEEKEKKDKPVMAGGRPFGGGGNKMMGGNFAKMLADKLKMPPPPGGMKKGAGARESMSKPPVIENNVNVAKLLEEQPFKGRKDKKKPTRKVFIEEK